MKKPETSSTQDSRDCKKRGGPLFPCQVSFVLSGSSLSPSHLLFSWMGGWDRHDLGLHGKRTGENSNMLYKPSLYKPPVPALAPPMPWRQEPANFFAPKLRVWIQWYLFLGTHAQSRSRPLYWRHSMICMLSHFSCVWLCDPMDCSTPGSSVHEIQARILEWISLPSSRESSWSRDQTSISYVSCIGRQVL